MTARVICDARAAQCRCYKAAGHVEAGDEVHECDPSRCSGAWTQDPFGIVRLPFPQGDRALEPWEIP